VGKLLSSRPIEYSQLKPLGEGSFSTVYCAIRKDLELNIEQKVAIKILKSQIPVDDWRKEFELLSRVNSGRCVRVTGWDVLDGQLALVLELVQGVTLDKLIQNFDLSPALTEELVGQIFEGLQDISRAGISHGDLSLKNVMVNDSGEIKILDFGLYKGGRGHFTPEFAAPEIFEQVAPTFFSDLYSLGRIQYFIESKAVREVSAVTLKMLALNPTDRDFTLSYVDVDDRHSRRSQLSALVREVMERKAWMPSSLSTTIFSGAPKFSLRKLLWRVAGGAAVCLNMSVVSATTDHRPGHLYIRTAAWSQLKLNGKTVGFSPVDVRVPAGEVLNLEFNTPEGTILRVLTVSPGQNIVLDDSYLKHRSGDSHGKQLVQ
jgi:serine/threonine protein kinase